MGPGLSRTCSLMARLLSVFCYLAGSFGGSAAEGRSGEPTLLPARVMYVAFTSITVNTFNSVEHDVLGPLLLT